MCEARSNHKVITLRKGHEQAGAELGQAQLSWGLFKLGSMALRIKAFLSTPN